MHPIKSRLIIFYRNPVFGAVKTRLAATIGHERALLVYQLLVQHTQRITVPLATEKVVYYSDSIEQDGWGESFQKEIQSGTDLGTRMNSAFEDAFKAECSRVIIIGTDCFELSTEILREAFEALDKQEAVIGPALDGGYYLLGMRKPITGIFDQKAWSTSSVLEDTLSDFKKKKISFAVLPLLSDVDEEKDLPPDLL